MQKTFNFFYAFLLAILGVGVTLVAEEITLTTYYPAPYGAYEELRATRLAVGSAAEMPSSDGDAYIGNELFVKDNACFDENVYLATRAGKVGVRTLSPTTELDVSGTINATAYSIAGTTGASGVFTTAEGKTVTVTNGLIVSIQ